MAFKQEIEDSYTNGVKGIILAGGTGTRLHPITRAVSKQLLPIYDKPMIHYPLSTLMLSGLREILLITTPHDQDAFFRLLGDGSQFGIRLTYVVQDQPNGLAEALILGEKFLDGDKCALILGDNLFYGPGLGTHLQQNTDVNGALIFAYQVSDPSAYGVVEFDDNGHGHLDRREARSRPRAATPCRASTSTTSEPRSSLTSFTPSARGELEITALNNAYLERGELRVEVLSRATTWLDTGTHESLYEAGGLIRTLQHRTGMRIGDVEQIAQRSGLDLVSPETIARRWRSLPSRKVTVTTCRGASMSTIAIPQPRRVLADLVPASLLAEIALVVGAAALVGALAQISIHLSFTPVPITGQTLGVMLAGTALGWRRAGLAMGLYVAAGIAGVPWFADHASGYVGCELRLPHRLRRRGRRARLGRRTRRRPHVARAFVAMAVGDAIVFLIGVTWLDYALHVSVATAIAYGFTPFVWGELIKAGIAGVALPSSWRLVDRATKQVESAQPTKAQEAPPSRRARGACGGPVSVDRASRSARRLRARGAPRCPSLAVASTIPAASASGPPNRRAVVAADDRGRLREAVTDDRPELFVERRDRSPLRSCTNSRDPHASRDSRSPA